jgi:hypothetical protein
MNLDKIQIILGVAVVAVLAALIVRQYMRESAKRADQGRILFAHVLSLFDNPHVARTATAGVWTLTGRYRNYPFQLKTVADTLATRKLPSLWLMVTLPEPQPVSATTNMMMRAAGVTSFSNFDFLPHTLSLPAGFPEHATVRSDVNTGGRIIPLMAHHLDIFQRGRGKELLVSPNGLRIVVQLAEGDRARYGVFREANFGGASIDVNVATKIMDSLIALRTDIHADAKI